MLDRYCNLVCSKLSQVKTGARILSQSNDYEKRYLLRADIDELKQDKSAMYIDHIVSL